MITWDSYSIWLGKLLNGKLPVYECDVPHPNHIIIDSRQAKQGKWFVPILGEKFDGHDFIADVMQNGCSGFFFQSNKMDKIPKNLIKFGIEVEDTLKALQAVASGWRKSLKDIRIASLTGSAGKTTTKEMTFQILSQSHHCLSTEGNLNNEIGVPLTLLKLNESHKYAVIETGARHLGDIDFLTKMISPDVVACINIGTAHIGEFGSLENLVKTKLEIFSSSPANAICVAHGDDLRILQGAKKTFKKIIAYGLNEQNQIRLKETIWNQDGTMNLLVNFNGNDQNIKIGASHEAYPINALAACSICQALGINNTEIVNGLKQFNGIGGRYKLIEKNKAKIIDDTYNANPDSMRAGLNSTLKSFGNKNLIVVLGDMLELGEESSKLHHSLGEFVATQIQPQALFTVGALSEAIATGARKSGYANDKIHHYKHVDDLIKEKKVVLKDNDIIYLKASNGIKLSKMVSNLLT